ncbi:uncharacterized protein MONOS_2336 [Monocercomonoides exilis]|uniref:uncharacterized protein n=1 Tax=Monocercomonoides exilis TaxID=2049356 RepID=UPI00355A9331|nr:hypothetical protein MONOS_2336 [Monocercomonoides exilis]|eukprot:MONOS_2336.1-p1 / transcript=MONOS_2336.1 / gene=MONOS_2336 / organism=Monocercomonoides_exilis_PA203 / gene_product=unspecified product / transcript_product=unspecified product / location=Mono_scaffold00047:168903-170294(+) / protein_length=428 / sequence_SO=supercontig / SO=protein_coding / is_pseudo=false
MPNRHFHTSILLLLCLLNNWLEASLLRTTSAKKAKEKEERQAAANKFKSITTIAPHILQSPNTIAPHRPGQDAEIYLRQRKIALEQGQLVYARDSNSSILNEPKTPTESHKEPVTQNLPDSSTGPEAKTPAKVSTPSFFYDERETIPASQRQSSTIKMSSRVASKLSSVTPSPSSSSSSSSSSLSSEGSSYLSGSTKSSPSKSSTSSSSSSSRSSPNSASSARQSLSSSLSTSSSSSSSSSPYSSSSPSPYSSSLSSPYSSASDSPSSSYSSASSSPSSSSSDAPTTSLGIPRRSRAATALSRSRPLFAPELSSDSFGTSVDGNINSNNIESTTFNSELMQPPSFTDVLIPSSELLQQQKLYQPQDFAPMPSSSSSSASSFIPSSDNSDPFFLPFDSSHSLHSDRFFSQHINAMFDEMNQKAASPRF